MSKKMLQSQDPQVDVEMSSDKHSALNNKQ